MSGKLTAYYDVGTTNLRLYLLGESLEPLAVRKRALGARDSAIAGTNRPLLEGMEGMYRQALADLGQTDADVESRLRLRYGYLALRPAGGSPLSRSGDG